MTQPEREDDTPDPRQANLSRRAASPSAGIWLVIGLLLILGALVYAVSVYF